MRLSDRIGKMRIFQKTLVPLHTWMYRRSGGKRGTRMEGNDVLLLKHTGRKSGKQRTTPMFYLRDGDDVVVVASNAGRENHAAWFYNLEADPDVEVQIGEEESRRHAHRASPEEIDRLWPSLVKSYDGYDRYHDYTDREFPVFILSPR